MSLIRSKNTKLEMDFLKELSAVVYPKGYRYRKHYKRLSGKPDIVFVGNKVAIFLDGDFWHGRYFNKTRNNLPKKYWRQKIENNIKRDKKINAKLKKEGWKVLRFWEGNIKKNPERIIEKVLKNLK